MRRFEPDAPHAGDGGSRRRDVLGRLLAITRRHYGAPPPTAQPPVSPVTVCDGAGFEERLHASLAASARNTRPGTAIAPASGRAPLCALDRNPEPSAQRGPDGGIVAWIAVDALESIEAPLRDRAADELRRLVRARIEACAGAADSSLGCYGAESFAWTRAGAMPLEQAVALADAMLESLSTPGRMGSANRGLRPSLGFAWFPQDGSNCAMLLTRACAAMRRARHYGMGYAFYSPILDAAFASPVGIRHGMAHNTHRVRWAGGAAGAATA